MKIITLCSLKFVPIIKTGSVFPSLFLFHILCVCICVLVCVCVCVCVCVRAHARIMGF